MTARARPGLSQLGPYKLLSKLGEGAMGTVYLAEDTGVQRQVALKVLSHRHASNPAFVIRFMREIKAVGQLNHPNIVAAYSAGEHQGYYYYVMEYYSGLPLMDLLEGGPVEWRQAAQIVVQIAGGLQHAHERGIIHRDIKPQNIFITDDGIAKILDLGLSTNVEDAEQLSLTQDGVTVGTPDYLSPEQAHGDRDIDGRADIYSLGITFYHLLTGKTPFTGQTAAMVMMKHLTEDVPNPRRVRPDIPNALATVLRRMTEKSKTDRYQSCEALSADLQKVLADPNVVLASPLPDPARNDSKAKLPSTSHLPPTKRVRARRGAQASFAVAAIAMVVLGVCGAVALHRWSSKPPATQAQAEPPAKPAQVTPANSGAQAPEARPTPPPALPPVLPVPPALPEPPDDADEKAFTDLEKELAAVSDKKQQLAKLDAFLKACADAAVAEQARGLRTKIAAASEPAKTTSVVETPKPAPVVETPKTTPPPGASIVDMAAVKKKVDAFADRRDYVSAIRVLDEAVTANPQNAYLFHGRALMKHGQGDTEGALQDIDKAMSLGNKTWNLWLLRATLCFGLHRDSEAQKALETAASLSKKTVRELQEITAADAMRTRIVCDGKKFETQPPASGDDFLARGSCRLALERAAEAVPDLKEALKRGCTPGPRAIFPALAEAARQQKQFKERLGYFKQWSECKPESPEAYNAYAWELLQSEDTSLRNAKLALSAAEKSAELSARKHPTALDTLALAYFENGRVEDAVKAEQAAIALLTSAVPPHIRKLHDDRLKQYQAALTKK